MKFIRDEDNPAEMEHLYFHRLQTVLPAQRKELSKEMTQPPQKERRRSKKSSEKNSF